MIIISLKQLLNNNGWRRQQVSSSPSFSLSLLLFWKTDMRSEQTSGHQPFLLLSSLRFPRKKSQSPGVQFLPVGFLYCFTRSNWLCFVCLCLCVSHVFARTVEEEEEEKTFSFRVTFLCTDKAGSTLELGVGKKWASGSFAVFRKKTEGVHERERRRRWRDRENENNFHKGLPTTESLRSSQSTALLSLSHSETWINCSRTGNWELREWERMPNNGVRERRSRSRGKVIGVRGPRLFLLWRRKKNSQKEAWGKRMRCRAPVIF